MAERVLKIALLFGGRSAEHEVSLRSAKSVFEAMDPNKYEILPVLITQDGVWYRRPPLVSSFDHEPTPDYNDRVIFSPDPTDKGFLRLDSEDCVNHITVDVVFPVLHGTYGEDGTVQGLLDLSGVPYVGCGVAASAVGMDKALMKAVFLNAGLSVGNYFAFLKHEWNRNRSEITDKLNRSCFPVFVKPANLGSSVGISRVANLYEFEAAVEKALQFDRKLLVEDGISGRELEVSVLGNDEPRASLPGEVVPKAEFYDYEEKYIRNTTELIIPAVLNQHQIQKAQNCAVTAFKAVDGSGLARVDMFLTENGDILVNEINTLPGFTSISMYPKLWEATGLPYTTLIDELIQLALRRNAEKQSILTVRA
jgi:D-alanine-D-alanine ligase